MAELAPRESSGDAGSFYLVAPLPVPSVMSWLKLAPF